jgi:hypothetical protein
MASFEPRAPERLIRQVILRAQAVAMGVAAQKQLETAAVENPACLASRVLVGQLAAVSELPMGVLPEQLARQLEHQPAFVAALRGGNIAQRLSNGELLQQITGQKAALEQTSPLLDSPQKEGPVMG